MEPVATENKNSAGELLKQGRLRQRLSIAECAKRTHIAPRYIEALEDDRWKALPSESHRLGFLKLYSRFLGVSTEQVLRLYRQKPAPESSARGGTPAESRSKGSPELPARAKSRPSTPGW